MADGCIHKNQYDGPTEYKTNNCITNAKQIIGIYSDGGSQKPWDEREYWRPSYMFHWLKAIGGSIDRAYETFQKYEGKASYTRMGLELPTPMEKDDDCTREWSHMSDYDAMGLALGHEDYQKQDDANCQNGGGGGNICVTPDNNRRFKSGNHQNRSTTTAE